MLGCEVLLSNSSGLSDGVGSGSMALGAEEVETGSRRGSTVKEADWAGLVSSPLSWPGM